MITVIVWTYCIICWTYCLIAMSQREMKIFFYCIVALISPLIMPFAIKDAIKNRLLVYQIEKQTRNNNNNKPI